MKRLKPLALFAALLFTLACSAAAFRVQILFPDEASKEACDRVFVFVLDSGNPITCGLLTNLGLTAMELQTLAEAELELSLSGGGAVGSLDLETLGEKLFFAAALDAQGEVQLVGCTTVDVGSSTHEVSIALRTPDAECEEDGDCTDDDQWCNGGMVCQAGACVEEGRDCDDGIPCTEDGCDEEADECTHTPDDSLCDNGDVCDGAETCDENLGCQQGTALDCDNGTFCDGVEICDPVDGCQDGPDPTCDDGIPCTADRCRSGIDACEHTPNAGGCPFIHIGPGPDRCPHSDELGGESTACDYSGSDGLVLAASEAPAQGAVFYLYDDDGARALYDSAAAIPGGSFVGAAPGLPRSRVVLGGMALTLVGDEVHVGNLTMLTREGAEAAISAWPTLDDPLGATGGHLIENIVGFAADQEVLGSNSITAPLKLGPDTTVRNCFFYGHWDLGFHLESAHGTRLLHNTFIPHQVVGSRIHAEGARDLLIANNVILSLGREEPILLEGDLSTTGLVLQGNVLEGWAELVTGLDPSDTTNIITDNVQGQAQMRSPMEPRFLADAEALPASMAPSTGRSLDGVDLESASELLPGAFQNRAEENGPRRSVIRLGNGDCGGQACDVDQSEDDELQKAVWSSWPGGTIEVYPSEYAYSGYAIIFMPLSIRGMGENPEETVLYNSPQDPLLSYINPWDRHDAMIVILEELPGAVIIENLTLRIDSTLPGDDRAIMTEYKADSGQVEWHEFRRLIFETTGDEAGIYEAMYLADRVLVQDVLIHGGYQRCITFGARRGDSHETPATSDRVVNLTCRLVGTGVQSPEAAFGVASVADGFFVNVVAESALGVPLFQAQRRSSGDTGATALDAPAGFEVRAMSHRGFSQEFDGFDMADGDYSLFDVVEISDGEALFVSDTDSHLEAACTAIDSGEDPADVHPGLSAGVSIDGVARDPQSIDQGAYEQDP